MTKNSVAISMTHISFPPLSMSTRVEQPVQVSKISGLSIPIVYFLYMSMGYCIPEVPKIIKFFAVIEKAESPASIKVIKKAFIYQYVTTLTQVLLISYDKVFEIARGGQTN